MFTSKKVFWLVCVCANITLLLLLNACTDNTDSQTKGAANHQTYTYTADDSQASKQNWQPSDTIQVKWNAQTYYQAVSDPNPTQLKLSLQLSGPFISKQDALNQTNKAPITSSSLILTNNWTNQTFTSTVIVPTDLTPGDYLLTQQIEMGSNASGKTTAGTTIHVVK